MRGTNTALRKPYITFISAKTLVIHSGFIGKAKYPLRVFYYYL